MPPVAVCAFDGEIARVLRPELPPWSVAPVAFRFPALAALAGRLSLGVGREVVMAALLAARLAGDEASDQPVRAARAGAARDLFRALCPDAKVRAACIAVADATAEAGSTTSVAAALANLTESAGRHLDGPSRRELEALAARRKPADPPAG